MVNVVSNLDSRKVPLGVYKVWWKSGGSSVGVIAEDSRGVRYIHCANWIVNDGPIARLDKFEDGIIKMELIE